jgi:hypothetical protein
MKKLLLLSVSLITLSSCAQENKTIPWVKCDTLIQLYKSVRVTEQLPVQVSVQVRDTVTYYDKHGNTILPYSNDIYISNETENYIEFTTTKGFYTENMDSVDIIIDVDTIDIIKMMVNQYQDEQQRIEAILIASENRIRELEEELKIYKEFHSNVLKVIY